MTADVRVALVGAGPRGTSVLERLTAHARGRGTAVVVHVVDPFEAGPGRIWRREQPPSLLMNSTASDVTIFPDATVSCAGPVTGGPSQYEWAAAVAAGRIAVGDDAARREAGTLRPGSYPSRTLHGHYLRWAHDEIRATAPAGVTVHEHRTSATRVVPDGDGYRVDLADGAAPLRVDAVVLSIGHYDQARSRRSGGFLADVQAAGLTYVPPVNAPDQELRGVAGGDQVLVSGCGLTFFDYVDLLTAGRGGRFTGSGATLGYRPSGAEPRIAVVSREGVPYGCRPEQDGEDSPGHVARYLTPAAVRRLRAREPGSVDFGTDVWPLVEREMIAAYYGVAAAAQPELLAAILDILDAPGTTADALARIGRRAAGTVDPFDLDRLLHRTDHRTFASPDAYAEWLAHRLSQDAAESARGGGRSAEKAVAVAVREIRGPLRTVISRSGLNGTSYLRDVESWYNGFSNRIASGPPRRRILELRALVDAGVVRFVGPGSRLWVDTGTRDFVARSPVVDGSTVRARTLIDAFLPLNDARRSTSPLVGSLLADGTARPFRIPDGAGPDVETGGLDVDDALRVRRADGRSNPGLYCFGPPVEPVQWLAAAGARPGRNAQLFRDSDAIAADLLDLAARGRGKPIGADRPGRHHVTSSRAQ